MVDEPHDVVKLLLKRMESHPEEFRLKDPSYHDRWYNHMSAINTYGNEADKAALAAKIRDIRMSEIHEQVMDELLSGDERRRIEREEQDYERSLMRHSLAQKQLAAHQTAVQRYQNAMGQLGKHGYAQATGIVGKSPSSILVDECANIGTAVASQPEPTLSTSAINQIKKALKL